MIVDINAYLGFWKYWRIDTITASDLIILQDKFGIDKAVISSTISILDDYEQGDEEVMNAVKGHPERLVGFASTSPMFKEESLYAFKKSIKAGMKGLKLFPMYHGYNLGDSTTHFLIEEAVRSGVPVMIPLRLSMNYSFPAVEISEIHGLLDNFQDGHFILGGVGHFEFRPAVSLMKKYDNVLFETSCLSIWKGIETLVKELGADRILFGTGMPIQYPGAGLAKMEGAEISQEDKALIFGKNAQKLLNL